MIQPTRNPRRSEVWLVDFDPSVGAEQRKRRPAVVLSVPGMGSLPLRLVVPITSWKPAFAGKPWFTHLQPTSTNGLTVESGADAFQVKSVDIDRFHSKLGELEMAQLTDIVAGVALCIGFVPPGTPTA